VIDFPDIIIMDIALAGTLNGIEEAHKLNKITDASIVYITDHPLVCEGLKKVAAEDSDDIHVIDVVYNGSSLLKSLSENLPDIVVLDITLPGRSGLDLLKDLKNLHSKLPVLILTIHPEYKYAARTIKAGAAGYLSKSVVANELVKAIHTVVTQKKRYITPAVGEQLASQVDVSTGQPQHNQLTDREYEVMIMIASGRKISEIAEEYSLAVQTIHTYRRRVLDKLNMKSDVELVKYATLHDLVD